MMLRAANSFARRASKFKTQPTVLVICEDSKSGKRYLEDATRHFRIHVTVEIAHCGKTDPKGIVEEAIRRERNFDQVFCTIDRDTHPSFEEAMALSETSCKVTMIPSYPCFEFWYLIHFGLTRKSYVGARGRSAGDCLLEDLRAKQEMVGYAKGADTNVFANLLPLLDSARKWSQQIIVESERDGERNPSTRIHKLIDFFESLSVPQAK
jgi:hypothetical protein